MQTAVAQCLEHELCTVVKLLRWIYCTSMSEFLANAPLAGPWWQWIRNQPAVAGIVPEIGARRRVILHTADDLFSLRDKTSKL